MGDRAKFVLLTETLTKLIPALFASVLKTAPFASKPADTEGTSYEGGYESGGNRVGLIKIRSPTVQKLIIFTAHEGSVKMIVSVLGGLLYLISHM